MVRPKRKITKEKIKRPKEKIKEVDITKKIEKAFETCDKDSILRDAKDFGLFKYNKKYRQWEIIIPLDEYEKI